MGSAAGPEYRPGVPAPAATGWYYLSPAGWVGPYRGAGDARAESPYRSPVVRYFRGIE